MTKEYDMSQVHQGTLWYRDDDSKDEPIVYLLTNMGGGNWVLASLCSTGNTWNGPTKLEHRGAELTVRDWHEIRDGNNFTYIGEMPDVPLKLLLAQPWEDEARELMWNNCKVKAIKTCRDATKWGLKEAKEYCEANFPMSRDFLNPFTILGE